VFYLFNAALDCLFYTQYGQYRPSMAHTVSTYAISDLRNVEKVKKLE